MQQQLSAFVLSEAGLEPAEPSAVNSNTESALWAEREPVTHTAATFRTRSIVDRFYSQTLLEIEVQQGVCRARNCLRSMSHGTQPQGRWVAALRRRTYTESGSSLQQHDELTFQIEDERSYGRLACKSVLLTWEINESES